MSALSIRNMNWTIGQREMERDARETIRYETSFIRSKMTAEQYNEWWNSTPDDDMGFARACRAKYDEIKKLVASLHDFKANLVVLESQSCNNDSTAS